MQKIAKKLLNTIIYILALSALLGTITVHAAPASESVNKLKKEKNKLQSALDDLQDELTAVMSEMDTLERSMAAKGEEIYEAEIALEEAQKREIEQQEAMGKRIGAMYENSTSMNLWSIIFQEASLADILKRADNVQAIYQYDKNALEEYQQTKAEIDELKTTLESEMEELQVLAEDYEKKQANVNALIEKKEKELRLRLKKRPKRLREKPLKKQEKKQRLKPEERPKKKRRRKLKQKRMGKVRLLINQRQVLIKKKRRHQNQREMQVLAPRLSQKQERIWAYLIDGVEHQEVELIVLA